MVFCPGSDLPMALRLYNTLSGKIEEFHPSDKDNEVRMYACGPTVYDYGHIGNFRTFVAVDILRRFLLQSGYKVRHVMNITDVDDKIIRNSAPRSLGVKQYTAKYERAFLEDAAALNIQHANAGAGDRAHSGDGATSLRAGGQGLRLPCR